ncbi:hypothetical protein ACFL2U_00870 [Patescibacteria group bacterium]
MIIEEKKTLLPDKFHPLVDGKFSVSEDHEKNELAFFFIDWDQFYQFLVLYEESDFADKKVIIMSSGNCQSCGQHEFIVSEMFLQINSLRAKIADVLGKKMLVHLCEECLQKVAGGKNKMFMDLLLDWRKIMQSTIPEEKKKLMTDGVINFITENGGDFQAFMGRLAEIEAQSSAPAE